MNKVVSEDAKRRALERIDESANVAWMRPVHISANVTRESGT